jgi:hypothetical protein
MQTPMCLYRNTLAPAGLCILDSVQMFIQFKPIGSHLFYFSKFYAHCAMPYCYEGVLSYLFTEGVFYTYVYVDFVKVIGRKQPQIYFLSFAVLPSSTYLLRVGVEGFCDFT